MKIIIAASFEKDYKKIFKGKEKLRNFSLQIKRKKLINLEYPFQKYKFVFSWISIRGVISVWIEDYYIPVFIVKKSDKHYGMNLVITWDFLKLLLVRYQKIDRDIKEGKYIEY